MSISAGYFKIPRQDADTTKDAAADGDTMEDVTASEMLRGL